MKPITNANTFKILPRVLLPKSATSVSEEAVNTMQELKKEERSQVILFFSLQLHAVLAGVFTPDVAI